MLLKIYDVWAYYVLFAFLLLPMGYSRAKQKAQSLREKATELALPRLATALVDFHKVQCYFMQAVQIAAITTIKTGRLEANNLQQLYNTWAFVHIISVSGFLPTTFVLLNLQSIGKRSWYLTILTTVTVAISAVALFMTRSFSPSQYDIQYLKDIQGTSACGGKDPTIWCLDTSPFRDKSIGLRGTGNGDDVVPLLIFSTIILVFVILEAMQIQNTVMARDWKRRFLSSKKLDKVQISLVRSWSFTAQKVRDLNNLCWGSKAGQALHIENPRHSRWYPSKLLRLLNKTLRQIRFHWKRYMVNIMYFTIWILYICFFSQSMTYFASFAGGETNLVSRNWTFGQIVGMTVWAEPLVEFLYLEISKYCSILQAIQYSSTVFSPTH